MKKKLCFILLIVLNEFVFGQYQDTSTQKLLAKIQDNLWAASLKAPEKFYVVTDRPWYLPGEEIWFKVYITTNELPVTGSGVLYVNLCDSTGQVLYKKIIPVDDNGVSYGNIKLPLDFKKGWHSLGVQTEWNRNFNDGAEKLIYINEREEDPKQLFLSSLAQNKNTVQFFPEGGNFVSGLPNHFGLKAIGKNGEPAMVKGVIVDNNDTLAVFETLSTGLGEFSLPPTTNNNLSAKIYWADGHESIQPLPQMQPAGITLQTSIAKEKLFYKIESFPAWFTETSEVIFVAAVHNEIVFSKTFNNTADLVSYSDYIPLDEFPNGIISLRLYTNDGKEIAQREAYNYKEKEILIDKKEISFEPKGKNELDITLPDTLSGSYFVSITDADLSEELISGNKEPRNSVREMNLKLLTGNSFSNDSTSSFKYDHQQGISASGWLYYSKTGKPVSNKTINFFPKNSSLGNFLLSDSLNEKGNFELKDLYLEDSSVLCWNVNGINLNELNKIKLKLNNNWFDSMVARSTVLKKQIKQENTHINYVTIPALKKYFLTDSLEKKKTKTLPEVNIFVQQRKRFEELDKTYASTSLFGGRLGEAFVFDIEEEKTYYPDIFSYLMGRIPGLRISGPTNNPTLKYRFGDIWNGGPNVAVFVGEKFISESSDIASIPVSEIAYVKVFKQPYAYILSTGVEATASSSSSAPSAINNGRKPFGGGQSLQQSTGQKIALVIAIYLKKGPSKFNPGSIPSAFQSFSVKGFSLPINFPEPDYSNNKEVENIPDKRITLYWNPDQNFTNGKTKIVFYNNDFTKRYLVKLEGINELGEVVSFQQVIDR